MTFSTFAEAIELREHLIALSQTTVYFSKDPGDFPWSKAVRVESGGTHRLNGPASCYVIVEDQGLTFKLNVDFEGRDANGRGVSIFDRDRLREVARKLPSAARKSFAAMLSTEVMPPLRKRSIEIRELLNSNVDSEDCVRGLIDFAELAK